MILDDLDILKLLQKVQESTTEDVDEEKGSFKKGDKVIYDMLGGGLTNSDLIRMLGTNEHATRANHDGTVAEIVEVVGEKVSRYSIMFEDGFVINDVAASELKSVNEDEQGDRKRWVYGTRDKKWYLVGPEDRDYKWGLSQVDMDVLPPKEAKKVYLGLRQMESIANEMERPTSEEYALPTNHPKVIGKQDRFPIQDVQHARAAVIAGCRLGKGAIEAKDLTSPSWWDGKFSELLAELGKAILKKYKDVDLASLEKVEKDVVALEKSTSESKINEVGNLYTLAVNIADQVYNTTDKVKIKTILNHLTKLSSSDVRRLGKALAKDDDKTVDELLIGCMVEESKTNEAEKVPQTMQPQEKPDINAEDYHLEDYSEEDFNKPDPKIKSKSAETGNAIRKVEDDELKIEPNKIVKPKKELKVTEHAVKDTLEDVIISAYRKARGAGRSREEATQIAVKASKGQVETPAVRRLLGIKGVRESRKILEYFPIQELVNDFDYMFSKEGFRDIAIPDDFAEKFLTKNYELLDKARKALVKIRNYARSKRITKDIYMSADEARLKWIVPIWDEAYAWEDLRKGDPSTMVQALKNLVKYAGMLQESKSIFSRRKPLWFCNECFRTFRSNNSICENCGSENTEKITEQDVPFYKHVYSVKFEDHEGKEMETRVEAFDEVDARKMVEKDKTKVKRVISVKRVSEGKNRPGKRDGTGPAKGSYQRKKYGDKGKRKRTGEKCPKESKLHEAVQELVGEVPGIDRIDQHILNWAIDKGIIPNEWPPVDNMIDELATAGISGEDVDIDLGEIDAVYLKHILLPKARRAHQEKVGTVESKTNEQGGDWDLTFKYTHNMLESNPLLDKKGKPWIWAKHPITDKKIRVFTDYQAEWVKRQGATPVRESKVSEQGAKDWKRFVKMHLENVDQALDQAEHSSKGAFVNAEKGVGDDDLRAKVVRQVDDLRDAIKKAVYTLGIAWKGIGEKWYGESREVKEQTYKTVAKGIEDRSTADEVARRERGMVVRDEEDPEKFMIIVKEQIERVNEQLGEENYEMEVKINVYVHIRDLEAGEAAEVIGKTQRLSYSIPVEYRSWGIKDITVIPKGVVEFEVEILDVDDKVIKTLPVRIDFDTVDYSINWKKGGSYSPEELEVYLTRDGEIEKVILLFNYISPE